MAYEYINGAEHKVDANLYRSVEILTSDGANGTTDASGGAKLANGEPYVGFTIMDPVTFPNDTTSIIVNGVGINLSYLNSSSCNVSGATLFMGVLFHQLTVTSGALLAYIR